MKLRIIKKDNKYYCQYKGYFFWVYYRELRSGNIVSKNTLKEAENWMKNKIETLPDKYFEVIKEYKITFAARDTGMK